MPYNNTPITPSKEVTGTVALPLARVKKIINADPDIGNCSNNASFVITIAAEMFLQHLVEQAYNQVKSERTQKPRRNVQYRDVANAVARVDNLEFLSDVVPRTMTFKQFKLRQPKDNAAPSNGLANGQGPLDRHMGAKDAQPTNGAPLDIMDVDSQDADSLDDTVDDIHKPNADRPSYWLREVERISPILTKSNQYHNWSTLQDIATGRSHDISENTYQSMLLPINAQKSGILSQIVPLVIGSCQPCLRVPNIDSSMVSVQCHQLPHLAGVSVPVAESPCDYLWSSDERRAFSTSARIDWDTEVAKFASQVTYRHVQRQCYIPPHQPPGSPHLPIGDPNLSLASTLTESLRSPSRSESPTMCGRDLPLVREMMQRQKAGAKIPKSLSAHERMCWRRAQKNRSQNRIRRAQRKKNCTGGC